MLEKSPFSKADRIQIGIVVRDMDKAIEHYESLGMGPFKSLPGLVYKSRTINGQPMGPEDLKMKIRVANLGAIQIELMEPPSGEHGYLWREFLETRGEGINHLGFFVYDIDKETAKLEEKGLEVIASTRYQDAGGVSYFDTGNIGGVLLELLQVPPEWLQI